MHNPSYNYIITITLVITISYYNLVILYLKVFDEDVDADDDLGKAVIQLNEINDDWEDWVTLQGTDKGKIKLRIQKLYPATGPQLKSDKAECDSSRMVQFYLGELKGQNLNVKMTVKLKMIVLGLFTAEEGYEKKTHQYVAKIVLKNGEEISFDTGAYEPKLKQTSAIWENAKHKVNEITVRCSMEIFYYSKNESYLDL